MNASDQQLPCIIRTVMLVVFLLYFIILTTILFSVQWLVRPCIFLFCISFPNRTSLVTVVRLLLILWSRFCMPLLKVCKAVFCFEICSASALYSHPETSLAQLRLYFSPVFNTFLSTSPHYSIVHITYVSYTAQKAVFTSDSASIIGVLFSFFCC